MRSSSSQASRLPGSRPTGAKEFRRKRPASSSSWSAIRMPYSCCAFGMELEGRLISTRHSVGRHRLLELPEVESKTIQAERAKRSSSSNTQQFYFEQTVCGLARLRWCGNPLTEQAWRPILPWRSSIRANGKKPAPRLQKSQHPVLN